MRRFLPTLLFGLLAVSVVPSNAQPRLVIPEGMNLDFGIVHTGKSFVKKLSLLNVGDAPLQINNVSASCGCTGTLMSKNSIPPHDSTQLTITFDPTRFAGEVDKSITMNTNDSAHLDVRIVFKANVIKALLVDPTYVIFRTTGGTSVTDTVVVQNVSSNPVHILSVQSSSPAVKVTPSTTALSPGESADILLQFMPHEAGTSKGTVTITTDHPSMSTLDVRFFSLTTASPGN